MSRRGGKVAARVCQHANAELLIRLVRRWSGIESCRRGEALVHRARQVSHRARAQLSHAGHRIGDTRGDRADGRQHPSSPDVGDLADQGQRVTRAVVGAGDHHVRSRFLPHTPQRPAWRRLC